MITAAFVLLSLAGACFVFRLVRGPSLGDRVIALDGLVVTIVVGIVIDALRRKSGLFLDAAVVVAFVGFAGAVAASHIIEERGG